MTPCYPLQESRHKRQRLDVGRLTPLRSEDLALELALALALPTKIALGEVVVVVPAERMAEVLMRLRAVHGFEQIVHFGFFADPAAPADDIVVHLLSISRNLRLRLKIKVFLSPGHGEPSCAGHTALGHEGRP